MSVRRASKPHFALQARTKRYHVIRLLSSSRPTFLDAPSAVSYGGCPLGPCLFSADLWRRRSTMGPLDSQPVATILQTESSRRSTTTDEKFHPRPRHRSAA